MKSIADISPRATPLQGLGGISRQSGVKSAGSDFAALVKESIASVNRKQAEADQAASALASGQSSNIHEVMIKMEEAEISLRMVVQMRNKVVEAYQEIMRMQV
ncbi:MAG: flagellar hook-basal body complex protein FliE [Deltaproteobacteria bacterium]|nr:flagellar hook-basal body complex protein FliE [Deltaproteobacteria bacterium]